MTRRRKCPGQYLGSKTIWIGLTRLLWAFDIGPEYDRNGVPLPVDPNHCTSGMTSCVGFCILWQIICELTWHSDGSKPQDFPVRITPRSAKHAQTIRENIEWWRIDIYLMRESAIYLVSFLARRANHTCNFKLCQHSYSGFLLILEEYIKVSHCTNRSSNSHSIVIMFALI